MAAIGLGVNFIGMLLSSNRHSHGQVDNVHVQVAYEHEEESLIVKSAYLEVLNDTLGAAGVIAAGVIILTIRFYLANPLTSIGLALFIIPRTWSFRT